MKKGKKLLIKEMLGEEAIHRVRKELIEKLVSIIKNRRLICVYGEYGVDIKDIVYRALDLLGVKTILYIDREETSSFHKVISRVRRIVEREVMNRPLYQYVIIDNMYLNKSILNKLTIKILDKYPTKIIVLSPYRISNNLIREYGGEAIEVKPLTFKEYLKLKGYTVDGFPLDYQKLKVLYIENIDLSNEFKEYLNTGGLYCLMDREFRNRREYINTTSRLLERMINLAIQLSKKRDYDLMRTLVSYLYLNPGQHIYYYKLSKMIGRDVRSLTNYLMNAYNTYLILQLRNLATGRKRARSNIKIYPYNHILTYPIHLWRIEEDYMGKALQALIARTTDAKYFWRKGGKEIDIIWEKNGINIPIAVRYIKRLSKREIKKVETGFKKMGAKMGILVSKDTFDYVNNDVEIFILPIWLFLLLA